MRGQNKPTIYTIAKALGVAPSTVSRALNSASAGRVGKQTVRRITDKAVEVGYEPNRAAVSLRTNRTATIGLVVPRLTDQVLAVMAESAEDTARQRGYQVVTTSVRDDPNRVDEIVAFLRARDVDGFVLATATRDDDAVTALVGDGVPFVLMNRRTEGHPAVTADDHLGGYLATDHLLAQGHERVGYIAGPLSTSTSSSRLEGYRRAHEEAGLSIDERLIVESTFRSAGGLEAARRLLGERDPPTAIFAVTDATAIGAIAATRDLGLRIPDDVAIVGYNDSEIAALLPVPLSSVRLPLSEMGSWAVRLLLQRIAGARTDSVVFSPELVVRASSLG